VAYGRISIKGGLEGMWQETAVDSFNQYSREEKDKNHKKLSYDNQLLLNKVPFLRDMRLS
jgi:hypothetical protein